MRNLSLLLFLLLAVCSVACTQDRDANSETEARNLETMRLWSEEVWGKGRLELVPDLVAPEYVRHDQNGTRITTPESYAQEIAVARSINMVFESQADSIDGDFLWTRWSASAQPLGGEEFSLRGIQIYRFADGRLAETWLLSSQGEPWSDD